MAKFDLSKQKRGRKVKRKPKQSASKEERKSLNLELIPVSEKWPPQEEKMILGWEKEIGWFLYIATLARQHVQKDLEMFGYHRLRYWAYLD